MALVVSPPSAEPSTSLLPIQTLTKVGSSAAASSTCVRPPRISVVSGLPVEPGELVTFAELAPGTATLLRNVDVDVRAHTVLGRVNEPAAAWNAVMASGSGEQPGPARNGAE